MVLSLINVKNTAIKYLFFMGCMLIFRLFSKTYPNFLKIKNFNSTVNVRYGVGFKRSIVFCLSFSTLVPTVLRAINGDGGITF